MNSILPSFISSTESKSEGNVIQHYHKIEIVNPKQSISFEKPPLSRADTIRTIGADILVCLGALMGLVAGMALALQSAGLCAPAITILGNLLMPSIAAVLAGSHLSKNDFKPMVRVPTGISGLTIM